MISNLVAISLFTILINLYCSYYLEYIIGVSTNYFWHIVEPIGMKFEVYFECEKDTQFISVKLLIVLEIKGI